MEKVSAMKKVALFMTTKRVARPMKFAAFISIIISMAVMIGACQGAIGPKGDTVTGPTGPTGPTGASGTTGLTGHTPFVPQPATGMLPASASTRVEVNPTESGFPVAPAPIALGDIFSGGVPPVTYKLIRSVHSSTDVSYETPAAAVEDTDGVFTAKVDGENLVVSVATAAKEVAIPVAQFGNEAPAFVVEATDAQKGKALRRIVVAPNRAPTADSDEIPDLRIGELGATTKKDGAYLMALANVWAASFDCTMFNLCTLKLADYFVDDGDEELTYSARVKVESDRDHVVLMSVDGGISIEGAKPTADGTPIMNRIEDEGVTVTVKATDSLGKSLEREFMVAVDATPTGADLPSAAVVIKEVFEGVVVAYQASLFFNDPDGPAVATSALTYETNNELVVAKAGALEIDGEGNLVVDVTGNAGSATVTVTFTEPATASTDANRTTGVGQSVTRTFTVTK